jgi:polysaccharide transporter, PST family
LTTEVNNAESLAPVGQAKPEGAKRELGALYLIHAVNIALPLVTTPFLSRRFGPNDWGILAFFQAFAQVLIIVIEFGFGFSATRHLARTRGQHKVRAEVLGDVMSAKLIMIAVVLALTLVATPFVPLLRSFPQMLAVALLWAVSGGLNLTWYFQGIGQITLQALIETFTRALGTALIFAFVKSSSELWRPLFFYAITAVISLFVGLLIARKDTRLLQPSWRGGINALRGGFSLFLYRAAATVCTLSNGLILSFFVSPAEIGFYAGAEKIARGALSLLQPLMQFLYSSLNHKIVNKPSEARQFFRLGALSLGLTGASCGIVLAALAPFAVNILLGPGFASSIHLLRILALLLPLVAATMIFGVQWMVPIGLDRQFTVLTLCASFGNLALALLLAPFLGAAGVCWAVVASEASAALSCFIYLELKGRNPLRPSSWTTNALTEDVHVTQSVPEARLGS